MRDLARSATGWDDALPKSLIDKAGEVVEALRRVSEYPIPRAPATAGNHSLHIFRDASLQAYGAVAYVVDSLGHPTLLGARVKLAPMKFIMKDLKKACPDPTIPRLELRAAVKGARLAERLLKLMPEDTPYKLYSDSTITLCRRKGDPNLQQPFEMRRILMIRELSNPEQWHHVPTTSNPADLLTREAGVETWLQNSLLWSGPREDEYPLAQPGPRQGGLILAVLQAQDRDLLTVGRQEALRLRQEGTTNEELEEANRGKLRPQDKHTKN